MTSQKSDDSRIEMIWGTRLLDEGFTPIPNLVLRYYQALGIEHGEWGLICTLMSFKHDHRNPYPHQETLAEILNVSIRQVRKWTQSLASKGLLNLERRIHRTTRRLGSLVYNFEPLIEKTIEFGNENTVPTYEDDEYETVVENPMSSEFTEEPQVPFNASLPEPEVPQPAEPEVPLINRQESRSTTATTSTETPHNDESAFQQIELAMMQHLARPYVATRDDYFEIKSWLASNVPVTWIIEGIHSVYETRPNANIRSFRYISTVLKDEWEKELVKTSKVSPIDFQNRTKSSQNLASQSSNLSRNRAQPRDERYASFYALFPDA